MKEGLLTFLILVVFHNSLFSQDFSHDYGKCSNDEFQIRHYAKDTTAEAAVIYDIGKSYFQNGEVGITLYFERRIKIKIFSRAGVKWGQFDIPFYEEGGSAESVLELEGNTYNYENGTIRCSRLDVSNAYLEKRENGWMVKRFAMPDVKEGSVVEVRYKLSSPYFFNFRSWEFQSKIPVIYSEYTTMMIPFYSYRYILQGTNRLTELKKYTDDVTKRYGAYTWRDRVCVFVMKDVPAFRDEAFISAPGDFLIKVDFQLTDYMNSIGVKQQVMTTWPKLISQLLDEPSFGGYMRKAQKQASDAVDTMALESGSAKDKGDRIFSYVKENYRWNGYSAKMASKSVKEFSQSKIGNSADINLFLVGMLKAARLEASPVIVSTRGHGRIKYDYPFNHFFNYVIASVLIDGQSVLLDATDPLCCFGMLPLRCLNDKGLAVKGDTVEWVDFSSNIYSSIDYSFDLTPCIAKDSINGTFKIVASGYDGLSYRKKYSNGLSDFMSDLSVGSFRLSDSLFVENYQAADKPFLIGFNASYSIDGIIDDKIIISPFCGYAITDNPLKQQSRAHPIDMVYKRRRTYISTIHIPDGYKLLRSPKDTTVDNDDFKIEYKTERVNERMVKVFGAYEFRRDVYAPSKYIDLKNGYSIIIDRFSERLIFVRG